MKRLLLSTLAAALLAPAAPATANTYDVYSCWAGSATFRNPNASSAAWVKDTSASGGHFTARSDCDANTTDGAMSVVSLGGQMATQGESAQWAFSAPAGTTLAGASVWRRAWTYGSGSAGASQRNYVSALANGATFYSDADGTSDAPYGTHGTADTADHGIVPLNLVTFNLAPRAPTKLTYRVGCGFAAGCLSTSASSPYASHAASGLEVFGAVVSVTDVDSPSIALAGTGLFDGHSASGVRPVVVQNASDVSGIKTLMVFADEDPTPIGVLDFEHDLNWCNWALPAPCKNASDLEIPVDTRLLADGDHSFVVKAYDAADNERVSTTHYATIKNVAPADPTPTPTPPVDPTPPIDPTPAPTGPGANDGNGLPNGISTGAGSGGTVTTAGPKLTVQFDRNRRPTLKAKYGRMVIVRGHLADGEAAIAGAQIDFSALTIKAGARVRSLGSVRTDGTGAFSLAVATKLGSRKLRFAYRPLLGGDVAASAEAQLNVVAPLSLWVGPKHVRNKHAVVFRGKLGAGPIPRKGKLVNLQVVVDGHWHTFATVRSTKTGRFKYRYRFTRTYGRVTYRFRALSRYEAAYPFIAGHSKTVRLKVN